MSVSEQLFLSIPETAKRLAVSVPTVRRWVRAGTLGAYKLGGQVRISSADIARLLESARIDPRPVPAPPDRNRQTPATGGFRELLNTECQRG